MATKRTIYIERSSNYEFSDLDQLLRKMPEWVSPRIYWNDKKHIDQMMKDLSYNEYYREILKNNMVSEVIRLLVKDTPLLGCLIDKQMLEQAVQSVKDEMEPYTVVRLPRNAELSVGSHIYKGVDDLKSRNKIPGAGVNSRMLLFPCFDSSDYAYENRYYYNFWFCEKQSEEWQAVCDLIVPLGEYCFINKNLSLDTLPLVYYKDDSKTMLYAY
mgnify:CR=1 FL=1